MTLPVTTDPRAALLAALRDRALENGSGPLALAVLYLEAAAGAAFDCEATCLIAAHKCLADELRAHAVEHLDREPIEPARVAFAAAEAARVARLAADVADAIARLGDAQPTCAAAGGSPTIKAR